jgi:hypothetical protein
VAVYAASHRHRAGASGGLTAPWPIAAYWLYALAFACWVPVVRLLGPFWLMIGKPELWLVG